MIIKKFINYFLESNTYVLNFSTNVIVVIDPSDNFLLYEYLSTQKINTGYIFLTHEHIDHISGTNFLKLHYPNFKIVATLSCAEAIGNPKKNLSSYYSKNYSSCPVDLKIARSQCIFTDAIEFPIKLYPFGGHSKGGLFINIHNALFVGDQFIKNNKTITKLPGGSKSELIKSYNFVKNNFDSEVIIYPGHGQHFTVNELAIW